MKQLVLAFTLLVSLHSFATVKPVEIQGKTPFQTPCSVSFVLHQGAWYASAYFHVPQGQHQPHKDELWLPVQKNPHNAREWVGSLRGSMILLDLPSADASIEQVVRMRFRWMHGDHHHDSVCLFH
jgi:hypothetical protein